jgi:hypothetical protein
LRQAVLATSLFVQNLATGRYRPIQLKKSAIDSTTEKYALEIEIFTLSSGFRVQISRSGAQKRRFQPSVCGQSGRTDFFNRIDPKLTSLTLAALAAHPTAIASSPTHSP